MSPCYGFFLVLLVFIYFSIGGLTLQLLTYACVGLEFGIQVCARSVLVLFVLRFGML